MCDCLERIRVQVEDHLKNTEFAKGEEFEVYCKNLLFTTKGEKLFNEFVGKHVKQTKNGKYREVKKVVNISHSYCPWCGEKLRGEMD